MPGVNLRVANFKEGSFEKAAKRWSAGFSAGMTFSEKVLRVVQSIPRGRVLTYKKVASLAGSPRAFRAVGNVLNKNTRPDIIPCHRVIRSDGGIGGYRWGANKKRALLKKELAIS